MLHRIARSVLAPLALLAAAIAVGTHAQSGVTVTIDVDETRRPIDPNIYGVAHATSAQLADLNAPLNRNGGNNTSRYNWQINADNRGQDWYFQSIPEPSGTAGKRGDDFVSDARGAGAEAALTIPTIGWIARLGANRAKLASYSIAKYGPQTGNDAQWFPDAGNGIRASDGAKITWNDPADANTPNSTVLQRGWINHLVARWGVAANGGLRYYILDNEPSLWHETHRDVHPTGASLDEVRDYMVAYAREVKNADPGALVVGPEEWGWLGTRLSGYDQWYGATYGWRDWSLLPDRSSHGQMDYLPWLLQQLRQQSTADGRRLLDVLTAHYYPQGGEFSNDTSSAMQARRNRSTRSLWDPAYVDESWIASVIRYIPQLRDWVSAYYPGTKIGITEYNWGAENHINGATTQADIFGIFGREGLDMAARWTTPAASSPTFKAMKLYRNYDGNGSTFGDVSVRTTSSANPDTLSVFGAQRTSDNAVTVMVVNKVSTANPVTLTLASFAPGGSAQVYQLTSTNTIARLADIPVPATTVSITVPGQSVTLLVVPAAGGPVNQPPTAVANATPTSGAAPLTVAFSAAGSSDPEGAIASYQWTFGDGTTGSGPAPSKTYSSAGFFTATLTVTDAQGATATATVTITVNPAPAPPAAPTTLTASASGGTVTLRWTDRSSSESGFYVERAVKGGKNPAFTRVGQVGANVTTFVQTVTAGQWIYRVQAFNAQETSAYSNQATIRVR
jgi:PKD repeat protein